jgi:hypothetical protein
MSLLAYPHPSRSAMDKNFSCPAGILKDKYSIVNVMVAVWEINWLRIHISSHAVLTSAYNLSNNTKTSIIPLLFLAVNITP